MTISGGGAYLKAAWWLSFLESANKKLDDRRTAFQCIAGILIVGAALRFTWLFQGGFRIVPSEAFYEAVAFATRGELADAYGPDTGLTAHLSPGMPLLVGTIYRWLGVGPRRSEFALACLSLTFIYVSFLALNAAFERLGTTPIARISAIALLALLPLDLYFEMSDFRHWEGALATAGIALCLARAVELDAAKPPLRWTDLIVLAGGGALMSLFSLPAAVACWGIVGWLALQKRGWIGFVGAAAASAALFVAISYPWALRNEAVFGEKVWTRSSFGFNFALGYHDKAINPPNELKVFLDRLDEVSPFSTPTALANMRAAGGEIGYNRLSIARTEAWIGQHPSGALTIAARHVREFYFPPRWMFFAGNPKFSPLKQAWVWTVAFVGFLSLGVKLARKDWRYVYVGAPLLLLMLPYVLAQPILRYRYPVGGFLVFLAADMVHCLTTSASSSASIVSRCSPGRDAARRMDERGAINRTVA
jgi:hypothetical protein